MARGFSRIEQGPRQFKASRVGFAVLTIVMLVVLLVSLGTQIRPLFPLELVTDNLSVISVGEDNIVLIDSQNSRLSITNSRGQVERIFDVRPNARNGERFSTAFVSGDTVYLATSKSDPDTAYLASEQIYSLPLSGGERTLLYQQEYDSSDRIVNPMFTKIAANGSDIVLLRKGINDSTIEGVSILDDPGNAFVVKQLPAGVHSVISASYYPETGQVGIVSNMYELYTCGADTEFAEVATQRQSAAYAECTWGADGCLYCIDPISNLLDRVDPATGQTTSRQCNGHCVSVSSSIEQGTVSCATSKGFAVYRVSDFAGGASPEPVLTVSSLPYSPRLAFIVVIEWVAIVYLIVCLVVVLVRLAMRMRRKGKTHELVRGVLVAACVAVLIGVSMLYSSQFYGYIQKARHDTVASLCEVSANTAQANLVEAQNKIASRGSVSESEGKAVAESVGSALRENCAAFAGNSIGLSIFFVMWGGEDVVTLGIDAQEYGYRHLVMDNPEIDESIYKPYAEQSADEVVRDRWSDSSSDNLVAYRAVYDASGQITGLVIVLCEISDLAEGFLSLCIELAMTLLAVAGVILLVVLEGRGFIEAFRMRREEKMAAGGRPEVWSTRPLVFLLIMASGFDAAMCVLVAREMLEVVGLANAEVLVGLPAAALGLGGFVGTVVYGALAHKASDRRLFAIGVLVGIVFLVASFFAVYANLFWLYCVCKFFTGVGIYFASSNIFTMPLGASGEEKRSRLFQDATMAILSGGAMGGLICGYVAQYLGNSWIYAFNIVPAVAALVLGLRLLPKGPSSQPEPEAARDDSKGKGPKKSIWSMFRSPAVLALLIFVTLPMVLAGGYKSILFPLFMDAGGLSKVYINNLVVFSNVIVFIISPQIVRAMKGLNQWAIVLASLLFCAAALCWFMINSTVLWGILALVLLGLSSKINSPARKLLLPREAKARGLSEADASNIYSIPESLLDAFKSPVLGALSALGQSVACLCLGIFCAVGAGLFALVTSRSAMHAGEEAEAPVKEG